MSPSFRNLVGMLIIVSGLVTMYCMQKHIESRHHRYTQQTENLRAQENRRALVQEHQFWNEFADLGK